MERLIYKWQNSKTELTEWIPPELRRHRNKYAYLTVYLPGIRDSPLYPPISLSSRALARDLTVITLNE